LLASALNEQGGGASLRLGRGGIPPPHPLLPPRPRACGDFFGGFQIKSRPCPTTPVRGQVVGTSLKYHNPILGLYHNRIYDTNSMSKSVYTKDYKEIINRLKQARADAGLSQQAVADKLGKPQSYVSKIESGERRLDVAELKKLSEVYKKPVSYFV